MQREQRLRGIAQRIGDGQPDTPVSNVEAEDARNESAFPLLGFLRLAFRIERFVRHDLECNGRTVE